MGRISGTGILSLAAFLFTGQSWREGYQYVTESKFEELSGYQQQTKFPGVWEEFHGATSISDTSQFVPVATHKGNKDNKTLLHSLSPKAKSPVEIQNLELSRGGTENKKKACEAQDAANLAESTTTIKTNTSQA